MVYKPYSSKNNWDLSANSVYNLVLNVLEGKGLLDNINDTFLTFNPKIDHPELVSQFRPIGLCNVAYEIITK